ncbi:MAG: radical SAM protein [Planctomycetaceae bacterium]|nr:radical SAM protein [Planctomycetaceae bacterium]
MPIVTDCDPSNDIASHHLPIVKLGSLDELWFQVAGTRCNLTCTHCFISCSPHNDSFGFLSFEAVERRLLESVDWGVKEFYFTGGEPFLNPDLVMILERTLDFGPATVLTNGTVLKSEWLERLRAAEQGSIYSLEFRVSIDGPSPELNDPIRGPRAFERALHGVELLVQFGFLPIITMTRVWDESEDDAVLSQFRAVLRQHGYDRPRLKVLPRLQLGAEATRTHGYSGEERVTAEMLAGYDTSKLICQHSRVITDRGIAVCPILIDVPNAILGESLHEAARGFAITHGACSTCYQFGAICTNPSAAGGLKARDTL